MRKICIKKKSDSCRHEIHISVSLASNIAWYVAIDVTARDRLCV